jgi:acetyl esterase/lipase
MPPTLILEGKTDTVTPLKGVRKFHDLMVAQKNRCDLVVFDGVGHLFTPSNEPDDRMPNPDPQVTAEAWREVDKFLISLGLLDDK